MTRPGGGRGLPAMLRPPSAQVKAVCLAQQSAFLQAQNHLRVAGGTGEGPVPGPAVGVPAGPEPPARQGGHAARRAAPEGIIFVCAAGPEAFPGVSCLPGAAGDSDLLDLWAVAQAEERVLTFKCRPF